MASDKNNLYFAAKDPKDTASVLLSRANQWFQNLESNGYLDKLRTMWAAYHGAYFTDVEGSHNVTFGGEQGELVQFAVNELRNVARHIHVLVTSTRPALTGRAINTDHKSLIQTKLANGLLDYYMRDKRLEDYLKRAVEYAIVLGSGYIKMEWNATSGEVVDFDEETNSDVRPGDVEFTNLSPFDVIFDSNREDSRHDWILCRSFKNRYDFIAKYPEYEEQILRLPSKSQLQGFYIDSFSFDSTDLIPVYEFYHRKTDALEDGRYMLFLSEDIICLDYEMPYRNLPVYRIAPADILGTPYGYTDLFDILPLQDVLNSLYSSVITNQTAFGVQNVIAPIGSNLSVSELSGGLNLIEADESRGQVRALQLTSSPKEVFDMIGILKKDIETISGVNSVSRGNPDPQLRSGNAMALVQSMTLQFISGLQQSYISVLEDLGTGLINVLKDHANTPRIAMITGRNNITNVKEFTGEDLSNINRVVVDISNPLSRTTAGRVEMAEQLLQMGLITTPEQYFTVMNTGQLDTMTEDTQSQLFLIKKENENLVDGKEVIAIATDQHAMHIKEHDAVLSDPELRFNPDLVQRVTAHIQEHINLLRNTDPELLKITGQQPLGPIGGTPANPPQQNIPDSSMNGQVSDMMGGAPMGTQLEQMGGAPTNLPSPAQPPPMDVPPGMPMPQGILPQG